MFKLLKEISYECQFKHICFGLLYATCKHHLQSLRCSCKQNRPNLKKKKKKWLEWYLEHGVFSIKQTSTPHNYSEPLDCFNGGLL